MLPEEGPELEAFAETRKKQDADWNGIQTFLQTASSIEPIVIDVSKKTEDESAPFIERSRNEIFDDAVTNLNSQLSHVTSGIPFKDQLIH